MSDLNNTITLLYLHDVASNTVHVTTTDNEATNGYTLCTEHLLNKVESCEGCSIAAYTATKQGRKAAS